MQQAVMERKRFGEIKYNDYQKMIMKVAWQYAKFQTVPFEELAAEGNLVFMDALADYRPELAAFSTFLWPRLRAKMHSLTKGGGGRGPHPDDLVPWDNEKSDFFDGGAVPVDRQYAFREMLEQLSDEAKEIIGIVLDSPAELAEITLDKGKMSMTLVRNYMRWRGWEWPKIDRTIAEIRTGLRGLPV